MKGTKYNRLLFRLVPSVLPIDATEYGLLPKVQTQGLKICRDGQSRPMPIGMLPTPTAIDSGSGRINKSLSPNAKERPTLAAMSKLGLLPTPRAFCYKDAQRDRGKSNLGEVIIGQIAHLTDGESFRLNPPFVAEMMGYPSYWTELPYGDELHQQRRDVHGGVKKDACRE